MMKMKLMLAAVLAVALLAAPTMAGVIYSDDFSGTGSLNGTTTDVGGGLWQSNNNYSATGAITSGAGSATIAFTPETGMIYTLSADVTLTNTDTNWFGIGFADRVDTYFDPESGDYRYAAGGPVPHNYYRFTNAQFNPGRGWVRTAPVGGQTARDFGVADLVDDADYIDIEGANVTLNLKAVLDTSGTDWSITYYVNGALLSSYTGGPVTIDAVGFTSNAGAIGTYGNFVLTETIPEPATIGLLAFGGLVSLMHRRRA